MTTLKEFARQRRSQLSRDKRLINAVSAGSIKRVRLLLSRGADPNAQDWWGDTPLHWACRLGREDLAKLLIEHGADPNTPGCLDIVKYDLDEDHPAKAILRVLLDDPELPLPPGKNVVFFDFETNGFGGASVLSFSGIRSVTAEGGILKEESSRLNRYYYPIEPYNPSAVAINGLTEDEITRRRGDGTYPRHFCDDLDVIKGFFAGVDMAVAHNIAFDVTFLPATVVLNIPKKLCTMKANTYVVMAEFDDGSPGKWPSLRETADYYGIELTNWHCGEGDVEAVMAIYQRMIARHYQRMIARQKEPYFFSEEEV